MPKKRKLLHDNNIINALCKIQTPIIDSKRNLKFYFKMRSRSNETGIEHIAKNYQNLSVNDIEQLVYGINNPIKHGKDKRHNKTYYYYFKRKHDNKNYVKVIVIIEKKDNSIGFISSIYITSKIR